MSKKSLRESIIRETELGLIAWVVVNPGQVHLVQEVKPGDFSDPKRGAAFAAAVNLADETGDVSPVAYRKALVEAEVCSYDAAIGWISDAKELVPKTAGAVNSLVQELRSDALGRRLQVLGTVLSGASTNPDVPQDHDGLLDYAERTVHESLRSEQSLRAWTMGELLDEDMRLLTSAKPGVLTGLPFGFGALDAMTCGAQPGDMIVLAARPSMGKSALAGQVAANWSMGDPEAFAQGLPIEQHAVALFTLEMSGVSYVQRMLCSRSGVALQARRSNILRDAQYRAYTNEQKQMRAAPLRLIDRNSIKITEFRSACRRLKAECNIKGVVVDYLQLMTGNRKKGDSREQEVSSISAGIKAVARELNIPVIAVAQLNRGNEQRADRRPQISDLRESGSLEQDADVIILLHREEYYHVNDPDWAPQNPDKVGVAEVIVGKQRNGPVGVLKLSWDAQYGKFWDGNAEAGQKRFA